MNAVQLNALRTNSKQAIQIEGLLAGLQTTRPITNLVRVMDATFAHKKMLLTGASSAQLSAGAGPSRFSPVNAGKTKSAKFKVIYGASDLATACFEAIIRDRFDLDPARVLTPDYGTRCAVNISTVRGQTVTLLDLSRGNAVRSGVPTDVSRHSNHSDGQHFSEFVHRQMPYVDGFLYSSRFTERPCVAIYWRAAGKLTAGPAPVGLRRGILRAALSPWNVFVS